jgi:Lar family restriction alleviation protein
MSYVNATAEVNKPAMVQRTEKLPCPFCGNKNILAYGSMKYKQTIGYVVSCMYCNAGTPLASTEELALKLWEQRNNTFISHCPFCGNAESDIEHYKDAGYWAVICLKCKCTGPLKSSSKSANRAWQQRI